MKPIQLMLPFELHPLNKFDFAKKNKIIKKNKTKQQPPHTIFRIKLVYLLLCNINIFLRNTGLTPLFFFFFGGLILPICCGYQIILLIWNNNFQLIPNLKYFEIL